MNAKKPFWETNVNPIVGYRIAPLTRIINKQNSACMNLQAEYNYSYETRT
jgi:hypothetical protein